MFTVQPSYVGLLQSLGIRDAGQIFADPRIRVWRSIRERDNGTIDATIDARRVRLHIKRDKLRSPNASRSEAEGILKLESLGIPTANLVAHGETPDGRSFVVTEHLEGYEAADKLIRSGEPFEKLLAPTAALAGKLHAAAAFHRDLYLCHFFSKPDGTDVRLIDCARVLTNPLLPRRWQVKDLAQFLYSTRPLPITVEQIEHWFDRYAAALGKPVLKRLRSQVDRKAGQITRHDAQLRRRQPDRNISIPD